LCYEKKIGFKITDNQQERENSLASESAYPYSSNFIRAYARLHHNFASLGFFSIASEYKFAAPRKSLAKKSVLKTQQREKTRTNRQTPYSPIP
jgi:hypothetical protein